jgi:uncharacterized protein
MPLVARCQRKILIAIAADEPMHKACFDQSDVFAFLADPATHELREPIIRIDTHGAAVFLAGKNVYKVKRAVQFPFMDFSTLDKRRRACERELAVNEADAPGLYLGVVPISKDGFHLKFGGGGTIVEWAVHLRRFDENRVLLLQGRRFLLQHSGWRESLPQCGVDL